MNSTQSVSVHMIRVPGKLRKGKLTVKSSVGLPDGDVEVLVASNKTEQGRNGLTLDELRAHPAFGIWKDRHETKDSREYSRNLRDEFNKEFCGERLRR
ncbi:MAG: hypothetical protein WCT04_06180 [Planctomycetota bacterium]